MSKSSLNFIYKRAYAVIKILKEWHCFMDLQHPTPRDSFKFYFLQSSNRSWYDFVYIYIALSITKTVHNLSVFMNYVPNEVLYVLTSALLKLLL